MSVYAHSYNTRRPRIGELLGENCLLIGLIVGVLATLMTGALWMAHNLGEQATPVTSTVTSVQAHHHVITCGKSVCLTTAYKTGVKLPNGQTTTVTLDSKPSVGEHWTVFKSTNGDYDGYSPGSFHDIFAIIVGSLLVGLFVGAATDAVLVRLCA